MSTLEISKSFNCPKEALYKAWTDTEQLKLWWKPLGKELVHVENELVEGGSVQYRFSDDTLVIEGQYGKVQDSELLEYSWNWHLKADPVNDAAYRLTVRFTGDEQSAGIYVKQDGFRDEESVHPHEQGWDDALEQLKLHLEGGNQSQSFHGDIKADYTTAGYNEDPEQVKVGGG